MTQHRALLVLSVGLCASPTMAWAASPASVTGTVVWGDFNGDGTLERAVSSPEDNCNKGAVYILPTSTSATTTKWTRDTTGVLGTAACDDWFGAALAAGDFNKDGKDDLAIGAPGADDAGASAAGAVHILYGSSSGLTEAGDQLWHQNSTGIDDTAEADDFFGEVLTAGDFNCDTADELVVGVASENIGSSTSDAGAVQVLYGSAGGVTSTDSLFYQGNGGVDGTAESTDRFGSALAVGNFNNDSAGGHGCDDLVVGSPTEDTGTITDAGWVYTIKGGSAGLSTTGDLAFDQNTTGVADSCENGDKFGARFLVGDDNGDSYPDLAVIVPGDSCHTGHGAGRHIFRGSSTGITMTGNHLECDVFHCYVQDAKNAYGCPADSNMVWASANSDVIEMFVGNDTVIAGSGNDRVFGWHGNDVIFGGPGTDVIDAGPGKDAVIAGAGNDTIVVDLDCAAVAGKVLDGGPGTDTVQSHLSSSALSSAGVTLTSIESYVSIPEGDGTCDAFPGEEGPFAPPKIALSWVNLPDLDSVWTTTGDTVTLAVENFTPEVVGVSFRVFLQARGYIVPVPVSSITVAGLDTDNIGIDLGSVIPSGTVDPAFLELPTSASLLVYARTTLGGEYAGNASAPRLWGHLENGNTAVFYREQALDETYYGGNLIAWRAGSTPASTIVRLETAAIVADRP
jgi:hypothetical protein